VDWFELWTRAYWRNYLGPLGWLGWRIQRRCVRVPHRAFCFSHLHESRLREEGFQGEIQLLEGLYAGPLEPSTPAPAEPVVVFAGRHIPDKRVTAIPPAVARAREGLPTLRAEIYGDGPDRPELLRQIAEARLENVVYAPGFVAGDRIEEAFRRALCLLLPSQREGYGLVVIEAAAQGIPSVVVAGADNAATELVVDLENGFVAPSAEPIDLSAAILAVHEGGYALRASTTAWFKRNASRLSLARSVEIVSESYRTSATARAGRRSRGARR
jgi:glycosyltransferase involved in cell wall biosynthesis